MFDWIEWFFAKNKPSLTKYPVYLGHTVSQEQYDEQVRLVDVCMGGLSEDLLTIDTLQKTVDDLGARIAKRDELITKLADDLQAANNTVERLSIENDALHRIVDKRKRTPRQEARSA